MHIVGLTGGIACGKTTVAAVFRREGLRVIDLDEISRDATKRGNWGYRRVVRTFGRDVLTTDEQGRDQLDRKKLADVVFNDKAKLSKLNKATHLPIIVELLRQILVSFLTLKPVVVLDCPLLFEAKLEMLCSSTVCVSCEESDQVKRFVARDGCTEDHAKQRIKAQMPLEKKRQLSDLVIDTGGSKDDCIESAKQVAGVYKKKGFLSWIFR
ncbi:dephospho-CoA kinase [Chloropicon primus]|uniref:Dephospho-CoA kinase n=1 Tax=Chloropicon primus TaxID=1764295 RepID=A0A5B8MXQ9_9CHLO|nr:dephospho-CoA kinase [Chloropicon primus]UPR04785.1 dephospho-CoA kinase [Chloropicon primus]|mmetsp:Transcript_4740/g.14147  ORF Transcript_4740/g.14147 Transcript_4740/m.14147 type:complete len:211 (-) Transcript_4740:439-1071(-)|eukprot:QDZ25588.1 dephospho-CoA kinase [Chloropicon primus]